MGFAEIIALILTLLCLALATWAVIYRHPDTYPPGPRGLPLIGAAFLIPKEREWVTYAEWKEKYGPIVGVHAFGSNLVILNTAELANQLLNKRSRIYSQRGRIPMLELMGFDWNIGIMAAGPKHTLSRQVMLRGLSSRNIIGYRIYQGRYARMLLDNLVDSPMNYARHLRRLNVSLTLELFFGLETKGGYHHDDFVALNETIIDISSRAGSPGTYLVNTFPIFKHWPAFLPGGSFHDEGRNGRLLGDKLMKMTGELQQKLAKNKVPGVFLPTHLAGDIEQRETSMAVSAAAATAYAAGIETTTSTLLTFVLAMVLYPQVQHDAQVAIDQAIHDRLPTLEDRDENRLPIIDAIMKECLRWAPPGALGLPHLAREEDTVDGYTIPKGTIVMSNLWAILHEEKTYSQPMEFRPRRFLDKISEPDPRDHAFGYGKRLCPGRHLAESTIWLAIASILATFNILPANDNSGRPIIPVVDFTSGVMSRPIEFPCVIKPRSEDIDHKSKE